MASVNQGEPREKPSGEATPVRGNTQTGPPEGTADPGTERRRSAVRVRVTYGVTTAYVIGALYLIYWLTARVPDKLDVALGVFAGLSSVATGVIGFWFGNRKAIQEMRAGPSSG